jgi:hypothetical protein
MGGHLSKEGWELRVSGTRMNFFNEKDNETP